MILPLVDPFTPPYEEWATRPATLEEMIANKSPFDIKTGLKHCIDNAQAAAEYVVNAPSDNGLSNHIQDVLDNSRSYKAWQDEMPKSTPMAISCYQKEYYNCDYSLVSDEICEHGRYIEVGQYLFHGGCWKAFSDGVTTRPLSTSLCPQVALMNALYGAKAYDAGQLDLIVLRVAEPTTKAFVFKRKGTKNGHEIEVLLAPGACLTLKSKKLVRKDFSATKCDQPDKSIPAYVINVDVS
ncbi:hypothetical protein [Maricaulis sp.]|uniref:hypothetical protein n=1 Tax=Maricaulis sp. TaxID=1486257 RepID=UPI003A906ABB